ncbi:MAG: YozE family protein [Candidatus Nitrosopolaris sp.]
MESTILVDIRYWIMVMPFYTWIWRFKNEDNAIGDLARDTLDDTCFPRSATNKQIILNHIRGYGFYHPHGASQFCLDTFENAWERYSTIYERINILK